MTVLNSRLQLALINRKRSRNLIEKGFTLVELMIVIVIVGVLSAVALPNFLGVKDKAELAAQIGEYTGLAKECSSAIIIGGPYPEGCRGSGPAVAPTGTNNLVTFGPSDAATANSIGVRCGPKNETTDTSGTTDESLLEENEKCAINVNVNDGSITYTVS